MTVKKTTYNVRNTLYVISDMVCPVNHLAGTSKTEPKYNHIQLTSQKPKQPLKKLQTHT